MDHDSTRSSEELPRAAPRRRTLRVVFSADEHAIGRAYELDGGTHRFGRLVDGIGKLDDSRVSREHAVARPVPGSSEYIVEDLASKNGTFLQGRRLDKPTTLLAGHVLSIGDTLFVVDQEPDPDRLPAAADALGDPVYECVGESYVNERLRRSIATVARTRSAVLLLGETGSGKEVTASAIHRLSGLKAFVAVNCAGIPSDRAEAELYGWTKGSFTSAQSDHAGYFVQASGGTLFLDEIADLSPALQASLLRALQDGSVQPLGGAPRKVDVRMMAATHKDLGNAASFRQDLFARISDWTLEIPPLRERRADILVLWDHFVNRESSNPPQLRPLFAEALLLYSWPLNVRELEKLAQTQLVLAQNTPFFQAKDLPGKIKDLIKDRAEQPPLPSPSSDTEKRKTQQTLGPDSGPSREQIVAELEKYQGNVQATATANAWHRTQLYRWIRHCGIDLKQWRSKE